MWRFKQQLSQAGDRLNIYHVEEVTKNRTEAVGVFVFLYAGHTEASELDAIMELYTADEMDQEFAEGCQEGYREAGGAPPPPPEAPPLGLPGPLEESPV